MWRDAGRGTHVKQSFEGQRQANNGLGPIHCLILNVFVVFLFYSILNYVYYWRKKMGNTGKLEKTVADNLQNNTMVWQWRNRKRKCRCISPRKSHEETLEEGSIWPVGTYIQEAFRESSSVPDLWSNFTSWLLTCASLCHSQHFLVSPTLVVYPRTWKQS